MQPVTKTPDVNFIGEQGDRGITLSKTAAVYAFAALECDIPPEIGWKLALRRGGAGSR